METFLRLCFQKNSGFVLPIRGLWGKNIPAVWTEFRQSFLVFFPKNYYFQQAIFGHHRNEVGGSNRKMYVGQKTLPQRVNARYEMKWANSSFKNSGNPIFGQITDQHNRWPKLTLETRKWIAVKRLIPLRVDAKYEMNWANSFFSKRSENLVYRRIDGRTVRRTEGQTSGWIRYTPIPPSEV